MIMFDHFIVNFFWSFNFIFDEWRMFILDYWTTYVCFRFVERRMFILDLSSDVYDKTSLNLTRHFIKLIVSDSSNLTKATHQNLMNENVISLNLTKAIHQTWRRKRHFIKSNERVISSNFLKRKTVFLLCNKQISALTFDVKNLSKV